MEELLLHYRDIGVSDLHLRANQKICYRRKGELFFDERKISEEEIQRFLQRQRVCKKGSGEYPLELDFSYQDEKGRYRVNLALGEGGYFLTIRIIQEDLPTFPEEIQKIFLDLAKQSHGLVLVTGCTGSGKSTTLRFFLEQYNEKYAKKIICLEDPIEYHYKEKKSLFFQREMGRDSQDFSTAIRAALRQDPDILLLGEIRDATSLDAALYFAESGHLVLSSLHTENCVESIHKILSLSPKERQEELRRRLSNVLRWLIAQELISKTDGERVAIFEILKNTKAVANVIFSGREIQLPSIISSSSEEGMCTKEQSRKKYR